MKTTLLLVFVAFLATTDAASQINSEAGSCDVEIIEPCSESRLAGINRRFSYAMMKKTSEMVGQEKNIFISPQVVAMMLSMLMQGAENETYDEIFNTMKFENVKDNANKFCTHNYYNRVSISGIPENKLVLQVANRIFGSSDYTFNSELKENMELLGAGLEKIDFTNASAVDHVNQWVSDKTNGKIHRLFDSLDANTVLALTSAIYFKGVWEKPLQPYSDRPFHVSPDEQKAVPFMGDEGSFKIHRNYTTGLTLVELPYISNTAGACIDMSMIFMMDGQSGNTSKIEEEWFQEKKMKSLFLKMKDIRTTFVDFRMPKFALTTDYDLSDLLQRMGIKRMFSPNAQLTKFVTDNAPPLYVNKAVHKAFVQVDEKGTEAAGAAGGGIVPLSLPPLIELNKPFHFFIYDRTNDNILFMGRLNDPSQAK